MTTTPAEPILSTAPGGAAASATGAHVALRRGLFRFSNKEWLVLVGALVVVIAGTTAAALSPDRSDASLAPAASTSATATAPACAAAQSAEATTPASLSATATSVAATDATPSAAATKTTTKTAGKTTTKAAVKTAVTTGTTPVPALVTIGSLVNFGTYANSPLRWRVLYADDDELLLLSQYVVSAGAFQSDWEGKTASHYSASEVRNWLLGDFATAVFSTQQAAALLSHAGGAAGPDRVFLLSAAEVERYLPRAEDRKAEPHADAGAGQIGFSGEPLSLSGAYAAWWLADAAGDDFAARVVMPNGKLGSQFVYYADLGVRPAIRVNRAKIAYTLDTQGGD